MTIKEIAKRLRSYGFNRFDREYTDHWDQEFIYMFVARMSAFDITVHIDYRVDRNTKTTSYQIECITINGRLHQSTPAHQFTWLHLECFLVAYHQIFLSDCIFIREA
jgi:hypothetical protein